MKKRGWLIVAAVILAGLVALVWVVPLFPTQEREISPAPEFGSQLEVSNARLVLPAIAGEPALIYFNIRNTGDEGIFISEVAVENGENATIANFVGPAVQNVANVAVSAGETVRFGPDAQRAIQVDYDSSVVPGAVVRLRLTFGNADSITVPLEVSAPAALTE